MNIVHYVDKEKLYQELKKYYKDRKANLDPRISEYIGKCIYLICEGLAKRPNFNGYTFKLDMISDGIEDCVAAVKNFNPNKSKNPFGYFSQIAWWAFVQRILIERKQQYLKHKNYQNNFMLMDLSNTDNDSIEKISWSELSDQVIRNFERTLTKTKKSAIVKQRKLENSDDKPKKTAFSARGYKKSGKFPAKRNKRQKRLG